MKGTPTHIKDKNVARVKHDGTMDVSGDGAQVVPTHKPELPKFIPPKKR